MRLEIKLEPSTPKAADILDEWITDLSISQLKNGMFEIDPGECLEYLAELRTRCHERRLTANIKFTGEAD